MGCGQQAVLSLITCCPTFSSFFVELLHQSFTFLEKCHSEMAEKNSFDLFKSRLRWRYVLESRGFRESFDAVLSYLIQTLSCVLLMPSPSSSHHVHNLVTVLVSIPSTVLPSRQLLNSLWCHYNLDLFFVGCRWGRSPNCSFVCKRCVAAWALNIAY